MPQFIEEVLLILSTSLKTQVALILGPLSFLVVMLVWNHIANSFDTSGSLGPLMEAVQEIIGRRYLRVAIGAWILFWFIAARIYWQERRRLFDI